MFSARQAHTTADATPTTVGEVLVLSGFRLMSQTVAAALRGRGVRSRDMSWAAGVHRATHELTDRDTVLLLDDLEDRDSLLAKQELVAQSRARFLVLTNCPEGPGWGAMLAAGAAGLMPIRSSLDAVSAALVVVARGDSPFEKARREQLVAEWVAWSAEDDDLRARMARLSARERTVLHLLARGYRVSDIGVELGIAEATVRSQIKSMHRKLDVSSQLAAVALVHRLEGTVGGSGPTLPSPRRPEP